MPDKQILAAFAAAATAILCLTNQVQAQQNLSPSLQKIITNASSNPLYTYPTSLTQGIIPKGIHSHNDYWRPAPFYTALSHGAISVEADVWLLNGTLHVGHDEPSLNANRTFDSLYVQPILSVLRAQNPRSDYTPGPGPTRYGVYDTSPSQTLYLFVDLKTAGATTWPAVVEALAPLREAGYLASYNGSALLPGPVTVVSTGNTPRSLVEGVSPRDYFWDGPLASLNGSADAGLGASVSPVASASFGSVFGGSGTPVRRAGSFNGTQLALLEAQVRVAHERGILVRYWDTPGWPVGTRNRVWRTLWDGGVDLLNVDDLAAASELWGREG